VEQYDGSIRADIWVFILSPYALFLAVQKLR